MYCAGIGVLIQVVIYFTTYFKVKNNIFLMHIKKIQKENYTEQ